VYAVQLGAAATSQSWSKRVTRNVGLPRRAAGGCTVTEVASFSQVTRQDSRGWHKRRDSRPEQGRQLRDWPDELERAKPFAGCRFWPETGERDKMKQFVCYFWSETHGKFKLTIIESDQLKAAEMAMNWAKITRETLGDNVWATKTIPIEEDKNA